ncbi:helix-turn-helix domain-containing protein [Streptomyces sp. NPDC004539]|uniref:helix-turn-helix domain-containing protein n=1 Tax=Streptomyces sp. NPDC004539 TaxID=3154280 RepID=UPI0033B626BC
MIKALLRGDVLPPTEWRNGFDLSVRSSGQELCSVVFARRGELRVTQAGREAVLGPRDFTLCDDSRPFSVRVGGQRPATAVRVRVPRAVLPPPAVRNGRLLVVRLSGREGLGALFAQFLDSATDDCASYRPADVARLGAVGLDLLIAVLAHHLDSCSQASDGSRRHALLLRIEMFIHEHLHDPSLSTHVIAAAHHISISYLHRLFQANGTTVAALIRRRRLEGARRDLTDPGLRETPVHQIAARWGFKGHAAFTRTFRATYGIAPREYRHQVFDSAT